MNYQRILIAVFIMALVTYLPRMLPLAIFKKKIKMPETIDGNFYRIVVNEREAIVEFNKRDGKSAINPIKLVDSSNKTIESMELYNGRTYLIEKTLVNDNKTNTINQSSILIRHVEN